MTLSEMTDDEIRALVPTIEPLLPDGSGRNGKCHFALILTDTADALRTRVVSNVAKKSLRRWLVDVGKRFAQYPKPWGTE